VLIPNYYSAIAYDKRGVEVKKFEGTSSHHKNFVQAMRSRRYADLNADILEGHLSSALCHTGNISYRLGSQAAPEAIREAIKSLPDAADTFGRMLEHLKANEVDLEATKATVGVVLNMNPKKEVFIDNPAANRLLTREYRPPFVVPEKV
jgi:hypothetical protein